MKQITLNGSELESKMRILICEDSQLQAEIYERFLTPISSEIVTCYTLHDCFECAVNQEFDLITYDLAYPDSLPDASVQKIKDIKERQPDVLLIVVTGRYNPSMERAVAEAGADGIIKKCPETNNPDVFMRQVQDIVHNAKFLPSHMRRVRIIEKATRRISEFYQANPSLVNEKVA